MSFLFDPNVAYLLLVSGFVLAFLALFAPGTGILELGAIGILVLAGYGIINNPFNWWAAAILLIGVIPFVLALRRSRRLIFLVVSLVALFIGSIFLITTPDGRPAVSPFLAVVTTVVVGVFLWMITRRMLDALALPVGQVGRVVGQIGEAKTDILSEGTVYVGGEDWSAHSRSFIPMGSRVVVKSQDGLTVEVEMVS